MKRFNPPRLTAVAAVVAALVLTTASGVLSAHGNDETATEVYSVKITYTSEDQLSKMTSMLDHPYVDQKNRVVHAEISSGELEAIQAMGIGVQIDQAETERIQKWLTARTRDVKSGATNRSSREKPSSIADGAHSCYRTVEQTYSTFDELKAKYPDLVQVKTLGPAFMKTQIKDPTVVGGQYDNSSSSYVSLLAKFLPASLLQRFNLSLFPEQPHDVKAIVVGNFKKQEGKEVPRMVWTGGIHAREYAPQEVGTKFIEWLLDNYGKDPNATMMVDNNQYHYIIHNPDGRKLAEQDRSSRQRRNTNYLTAWCASSPLQSGVDLNRNYPFGWATGGAGGSDGNVCGDTYRGTEAESEPETKAVLKYVRGEWNQEQCKWVGGALPDGRPKSAEYCNKDNRNSNRDKPALYGQLDWKTGASEDYPGGVFIDLHSNARAILWPWGVERTENENNTHTPNNKGMATIAQRLAYHNNYSSQQLLSYNTEGTTKDAFYGYLGAPSYTVEMGRSFYEDCGVFERETYPENFNGFHYLSRVLHRVYKLPFGPDTVDVKVEQSAPVAAGAKVQVSALVDDNRYRYSNAGQANIKPPPYPVVYNIQKANVYIDTMPWEAGAVAKELTLNTSDKAQSDFPDATKRATGEIDTTGLAPGRHMVYVQGINSDGKEGAVSAAFLDIAEAPKPEPEKSDGGGALGGLVGVLSGLAALAFQRRRKALAKDAS